MNALVTVRHMARKATEVSVPIIALLLLLLLRLSVANTKAIRVASTAAVVFLCVLTTER